MYISERTYYQFHRSMSIFPFCKILAITFERCNFSTINVRQNFSIRIKIHTKDYEKHNNIKLPANKGFVSLKVVPAKIVHTCNDNLSIEENSNIPFQYM